MKKMNFLRPGQLSIDVADAVFEIVFYDTIQDLPMKRLNEFNIHLSQDSGIGSTIHDFDERLNAIMHAVGNGSIENARKEWENSRLGLYLMLSSISTKARCLADLVYSINHEVVSAFSDEDMMRVHDVLAAWLSDYQAQELIDDLKKKFRSELKTAFPALFPDIVELEFYLAIVKRAKLQLQQAIEDEDVLSSLKEINDWLADQMQPENFDFEDSENAVETKRRDFAVVCACLAMKGIQNAELLSAYAFHAAILAIQLQQKPAPKSVTQ